MKFTWKGKIFLKIFLLWVLVKAAARQDLRFDGWCRSKSLAACCRSSSREPPPPLWPFLMRWNWRLWAEACVGTLCWHDLPWEQQQQQQHHQGGCNQTNRGTLGSQHLFTAPVHKPREEANLRCALRNTEFGRATWQQPYSSGAMKHKRHKIISVTDGSTLLCLRHPNEWTPTLSRLIF